MAPTSTLSLFQTDELYFPSNTPLPKFGRGAEVRAQSSMLFSLSSFPEKAIP